MYKILRIHKHEKMIKEIQIDHKLGVYSNKKYIVISRRNNLELSPKAIVLISRDCYKSLKNNKTIKKSLSSVSTPH